MSSKLRVDRSRRFSVLMMSIMFLGVDLTSFHVWPVLVQLIICVAWELLVLFGAVSTKRGVLVLTILASCIKAMTIALIVWILVYPHSHFGPTVLWYWIPLGALNMGTGLWLLQLIRKRAK